MAKVIGIENKEEELGFTLEVVSTDHSLRRWSDREQLEGRFGEKTPDEVLVERIENSTVIQEQLCLLIADGDYTKLRGRGIPVGFEFKEGAFMVAMLTEEKLFIVTVNDTLYKRYGFHLHAGEHFFDKNDVLCIAS